MAATIARRSWITVPTLRSFEEAWSMAKTATGMTRKVIRVSRQLRKSSSPIMPTKVTPCTTKSTTTEARIFCSVATSFVMRERNSPERLLYSVSSESLCVWS